MSNAYTKAAFFIGKTDINTEYSTFFIALQRYRVIQIRSLSLESRKL